MKKLLVMASLFLLSSNAFAGPSVTGGGKGVVCRNGDGSVRTVELLDLWEAEHLFNRAILRSDAPVIDQVQEAISKLTNFRVISIDDLELQNANRELWLKMVKQGTDVFFGKPWPKMTIQRLRGSALTLSDDSFEDARPQECAVEQIILYKLGASTFYINQDLFERLPNTDQAALILHESLYSLMRLPMMKTPSSVRTRRAIGYLFAGNKFDSFPERSVAHTTCSADFDGLPSDVFVLFHDQATSELRSVVLDGYADEHMTGYFPRKIKSYTWASDHEETLLTNKQCEGQKDGELFPVAGLGSDGPVDFDRNGALVGSCRKGKFSPYWVPNGVIPIHKENALALKCVFHQGS